MRLLSTGEFPHLSAINESSQADPPGPAMTDDALGDQFERGLAALLDGLVSRLEID